MTSYSVFGYFKHSTIYHVNRRKQQPVFRILCSESYEDQARVIVVGWRCRHRIPSLGEAHLCWAAVTAGFETDAGGALVPAAAFSLRLSSSSDCAQMYNMDRRVSKSI